MKSYWKSIFSWLLLLTVFSCRELPYDLEVFRFKNKYSITDKNGYPVIAEGFNVAGELDKPEIKKLIQYSKNDLGLVVMILTHTDDIRYVSIIPKPEQNYAELDVSYTIYTEEEYKKLNLNDDWIRINQNEPAWIEKKH